MNRSVLVVDDDRNIVRTLSDLLRRRGWRPRPAHSGEEAVEVVEAEPVAAVVMDVRMGGMNGVEALRAIRARRPHVPVVLMTAYSSRDLLAEAEALGAVRIYPKPLPLAELLTLLDRVAVRGERVLLVDDDAAFLRTLAGILGEHGHRALQASSLADALDLLHRDEPAVVVLDLKLDHRAPQEVVRAVRGAAPDSAALVLCSGFPDLMEETVASCPHGWFHATLAKPFPPERLLDLLEHLAPND